VKLQNAPLVDVRPLMLDERADLLDLLQSLNDDDWSRQTACPGWTVKDVALHILDDDFGLLSRERDGDASSLLPKVESYREFVASLNRKNQQWVEAARGLSSRVICQLLGFTGRELGRHFETVDFTGTAGVAWTGPEPVSVWFDLARELTEHWVHQQQIRDAVKRPGAEKYLGTVLRVFLWALPYHYRTVEAPPGSVVRIVITGQGGGQWALTKTAQGWELDEMRVQRADAQLLVSEDNAWRLLTGALNDTRLVEAQGDSALAQPFLETRSIII
jgi:uncharacterized protein (TIGR03083 family)